MINFISSILALLLNFGLLYFSAKYLFHVSIDNFTLGVYSLILTVLGDIHSHVKPKKED
jgi:hypothetical protein